MAIPLSPTQQRVVDLLPETGGNVSEVARVMGLSRSTVNNHIRAIRKKGHDPEVLPRGSNATGVPSIMRSPSIAGDMSNEPPDGYRVKGVSTLYRSATGEPVMEWVKTTADEDRRQEMMREAVEAFKADIPRAAPVKCRVKNHESDLLNLFVLTDYHLGMYSWAPETGADWDIDIAEDLLVKWIIAAVRSCPQATTAVLAQLGDFIHFDGLEALTPEHRNLLDADTRFQMIVRVAIRCIRRVVRELLKKHQRVHLIMAEGNHDPASSVWLRELFRAFYEDEDRITIDASPNPYYCYRHGKVSLFFHHGHKRTPAKVSEVFAAQYRDVFGGTEFSYAHMGHMHHDKLETNLMTVEQHKTLAAPDAFAARGGWLADRCARAITYHREFGEVGRVTRTPDMLR